MNHDTQITQEDRDAAANIVAWQIGTGWEPSFFAPGFPDAIRKGTWDEHDVVQAFARHRRTALTDAREKALREAADVARGYWVEADYDTVGVADADMAMELCSQAAAAILALGGQSA